jgi:hypothetical protein
MKQFGLGLPVLEILIGLCFNSALAGDVEIATEINAEASKPLFIMGTNSDVRKELFANIFDNKMQSIFLDAVEKCGLYKNSDHAQVKKLDQQVQKDFEKAYGDFSKELAGLVYDGVNPASVAEDLKSIARELYESVATRHRKSDCLDLQTTKAKFSDSRNAKEIYNYFRTIGKVRESQLRRLKSLRKSLNFNGPSWQLVWSEEFNEGSELDQNEWIYQTGEGHPGNSELQYYTDRKENTKIENGNLVLEARIEKFKNVEYTSSRLVTKQGWKYGRFEFRAKIPQGRGGWPAIWMLPLEFRNKNVGWPLCGEVDIAEQREPGLIKNVIHTGAFNWIDKTHKGKGTWINDPAGYHLYVMEWYPTHLDFYIDHKRTFRFSKQKDTVEAWPYDKEFYLIFNIAIGGGVGKALGIDPNGFPQQMVVDYIRIFKQIPESTPRKNQY